MYSIGPQEDVKSLWDIAPISIVEPLNRWESLLELICSYKEGPLKYMCICWSNMYVQRGTSKHACVCFG